MISKPKYNVQNKLNLILCPSQKTLQFLGGTCNLLLKDNLIIFLQTIELSVFSSLFSLDFY